MSKLTLMALLPLMLAPAWATTPVSGFNASTDPIVYKLKSELSTDILDAAAIDEGAKLSEAFYGSCLVDVINAMQTHFTDAPAQRAEEVAFMTCEYPEDVFNTYNVLLAAKQMQMPMSEQDAYGRVVDGYAQEGGRVAYNDAMRQQIMQNLRQHWQQFGLTKQP